MELNLYKNNFRSPNITNLETRKFYVESPHPRIISKSECFVKITLREHLIGTFSREVLVEVKFCVLNFIYYLGT